MAPWGRFLGFFENFEGYSADMCAEIFFASVDLGPSGGSCVYRPGIAEIVTNSWKHYQNGTAVLRYTLYQVSISHIIKTQRTVNSKLAPSPE
jgi:hypothetical protein